MDIEHSRSRAITRTFANTWRAFSPDHKVVYRDLYRDPPPHLNDMALHWPPRLRGPDPVFNSDAERLQQNLLDELLAADALLIDAALYNFSFPSTLKSCLDYIHLPGLTAAFDSQTQPMAGRRAVVIVARDAAYDPGTPSAGWDHATPVLQIILGTSLGMEVSVITTDLTLANTVPMLSDQSERAATELANAHAAAANAAQD